MRLSFRLPLALFQRLQVHINSVEADTGVAPSMSSVIVEALTLFFRTRDAMAYGTPDLATLDGLYRDACALLARRTEERDAAIKAAVDHEPERR